MSEITREWIESNLADYKACRSHREISAIESMIAQVRVMDAEALLDIVGTKGSVDLQTTRLHKAVVRGLGQCIGDHGKPITRDEIGSAAKRITTIISDVINAAMTASEGGTRA